MRTLAASLFPEIQSRTPSAMMKTRIRLAESGLRRHEIETLEDMGDLASSRRAIAISSGFKGAGLPR